MDLLVDAIQSKKLVLPKDPELLKSWAQVKVKKSQDRQVFTKGVHSLDATRAILSAIWLSRENLSLEEPLNVISLNLKI